MQLIGDACFTPERLAELATRAAEQARDRAASFRWDPFGGAALQAEPAPFQSGVPRPPLRVLLPDKEGTLFWDIHDPRVEIVGLADPGASAPDIVVLTRADRFDLEKSAGNLSPALWSRLRSGAAKLVLDASSEGTPHSAKRTAALHGFLDSKGIPRRNAAYLTQDRGYPAHYAGHCDELGLGDSRTNVWIYDRFIQRTFAAFHDRGEDVFQERLALYAARSPRRRRRFISLNYTVRPIKALFLLNLLRDGLWDSGFISVGPLEAFTEKTGMSFAQYLRKHLKRAGRLDMFSGLEPWLSQFEAMGPVSVGEDPPESLAVNRSALLTPSAFPEYQQSWFTVVTESNPSDRLSRITEKPFKPLLNFHPMIFLASFCALRLLRAYGFDSYAGFFDEAYDDEPEIRGRFGMVYEQVAALCRADEAELARRDAAVAETTVFNAYWGLVQLPKLFRSHIDAALIDRLLWLAHG